MTLVDSSGWLAYVRDEPHADAYVRHLEGDDLIVPALVIYEVYKAVVRDDGEEIARSTVARMKESKVVPVDEAVAIDAAHASLAHGLHMADAVIYATARLHDATLVTSDAHFEGLDGVEYIPRPTPDD